MYTPKIGDKVKGIIKRFNEQLDDYVDIPYKGTITHSFNDGSYIVQNLVDDNRSMVLVETYFEETIEVDSEQEN